MPKFLPVTFCEALTRIGPNDVPLVGKKPDGGLTVA